LWLLYAAVMWLWHMPVLYQAALSNESIHMLQHLMFLVVALGFWAGILHSQPSRKKQVAFGASVLYAFAMALQTGMLGALLTFASHAWYERYATTASFWGLSALDDQQLAGLILWIPGGLVYVVTGMVLFVIWLNAVERDVRERERQAQLEYPAPPTLTEKSGQLTWLDK
jgi:putative membrane protein